MTRRRSFDRGRAGQRYECPTPGCFGERLHWQASCRSCWKRVPADLRSRMESARAAKGRHLISGASMAIAGWLVANPPAVAIARITGEGAR
ncbi:MAG: hypothetical protein FJ335_01410 [Sphingomonadales bacterium]|nr:hypothetical protein [Sphingomonadales bacterium]